MSDSVTFEFRTNQTADTIYKHVKSIWIENEFIEVCPVNKLFPEKDDNLIICILSYFIGSEHQINCIRQILDYLLDIAADGYVHYYRCYDTIDCCEDYKRILLPGEIFKNQYSPAMYDGIQYRYRIQKER